MNTSLTLMEVLMFEPALGDAIMKFEKSKDTINISNVCTVFNSITKDQAYLCYNEHLKTYIPNKIDEILTNMVFAKDKNPKNVGKYNSIEEYQEELNDLIKKINDDNREIIYKFVFEKYTEYEFDYSNADNRSSYIYRELMEQYYNLLIILR